MSVCLPVQLPIEKKMMDMKVLRYIFMLLLMGSGVAHSQNNALRVKVNSNCVVDFFVDDIASVTFDSLSSQMTASAVVTGNQARISSAIKVKSSFSPSEYGVCFNRISPSVRDPNYFIDEYQPMDSLGGGLFETTLFNLQLNSTYYYRPYVKIGDAVVYGPSGSFAIGTIEQMLTPGDYIDLGLSVKWASKDLHAKNVYDRFGESYRWGDIDGSPGSYQFAGSWSMGQLATVTKYNNEDGLTQLLPGDDAATAALGAPYRMPTADEVRELAEKCKVCCYDISPYGKFAYVQAPNGNSILIPLYLEKSECNIQGVSSSYDKCTKIWTSTRAYTPVSAAIWHVSSSIARVTPGSVECVCGVVERDRSTFCHIRAVCP